MVSRDIICREIMGRSLHVHMYEGEGGEGGRGGGRGGYSNNAFPPRDRDDGILKGDEVDWAPQQSVIPISPRRTSAFVKTIQDILHPSSEEFSPAIKCVGVQGSGVDIILCIWGVRA